MTRSGRPRIGPLVALQVVVAASALTAAPLYAPLDRPLLVVAFAIGFSLVGSVQMHVELRRHSCAITLVEAVLVLALLWLAPVEVTLAAAVGEGIACLLQRQPRAQLMFNVTATAAAVAVASAAFQLLTMGSRDLATLVISGLAAATCCGAVNLLSTSTVLSIVEIRRFGEVLRASLVPAAVATVVSSTVGVVAVVLASQTPAAALLVLPMVGLLVLGTRGLAAQRAEQLRFQRLYEASARTGDLQSLSAVLERLAAEARTLVTGASAICATVASGGSWQGVLVDDRGSRAVPRLLLDDIRAAASASGEVPTEQLPESAREALGPAASIVMASPAEKGSTPVVLLVARSLPADRGGRARAEVLAAFAGHAALTVANARLYADVEQALARQVDLNRQKDDFVAVMSHELRTPLTTMLGSVDTLRRMDHRLTAEHRDQLTEMALRQGHHLQQLIEELLLLATVDHGRQPQVDVEPVDLEDLVADVVSIVASAQDGEPLQVSFTAARGSRVATDAAKLRRILVCLLDNARKFAPEAPVSVLVRRGVDGDDPLVVDIADRGPGIAPEDRERVFERFVQLDQTSTRAAGGTGLGLYLARQLARVLGGSLVLSEAEGGGCCFTLTLPLPVINADAPAIPDGRSLVAVGHTKGDT